MDQHLPEAQHLSMEEIDGEDAVSLPDKEVLSLLDVNADVDLGLDLAAPVDLAAAANLNVAAPIEAAASANLLSPDAQSIALAQQTGSIQQGMTGVDANAEAIQQSDINQTADAGEQLPDGTEQAALADGTVPAEGTPLPVGEAVDGATNTVGGVVDGASGPVGDTVDGATDVVPGTTDTVDEATDTVGGVTSLLNGGSLLEANVNIDADANLTAPVAGAVAANANVAAPIDAAVAANIGSEGAVAQAAAVQDVDIVQTMDDVSADATADQNSEIDQ